ncbi:MAG TPA: hypothetical protein VML50_00160 [Anaeromyxobacter sp.]|nr:hypothetical protein [Anaeromyxobacter sp.]
MADFVTRAVERLRADPRFSRNRHLVALSSPEGRRALRIHRHLRSLERDLAGGAAVTVAPEAERVRLTLRGRRGTRIAWLSRAEYRLLCTDPAVRAVLGPRDGEGAARSRTG